VKVSCPHQEHASPSSSVFHKIPVPGHHDGVWYWTGENLSDSQNDILLFWLVSEHFLEYFNLDLSVFSDALERLDYINYIMMSAIAQLWRASSTSSRTGSTFRCFSE
jgi:hypothetical protein